jgi:miniconductance mechanosensitive channel
LNFPQFLNEQFVQLGLNAGLAGVLSYIAVVIAALLVCLISFWVTRSVLVSWIRKAAKRTSTQFDDVLVKRSFFSRLAQITPAVLLISLAPVLFPDSPGVQLWIRKLAGAYAVVCVAAALSSLIQASPEQRRVA